MEDRKNPLYWFGYIVGLALIGLAVVGVAAGSLWLWRAMTGGC